MIKLIPMNEADYEAFTEISTADHAQEQIKAGCWSSEEADKKIEISHNRLLPQGLATSNHYFFNVHDDENGQVGGLWYQATENNGVLLIFVFHIYIYEQYRRYGYGSQAFHLMEDQALEMNITTIVLNVFEHNYQARAMYEKIGYTGEGQKMSKEIN